MIERRRAMTPSDLSILLNSLLEAERAGAMVIRVFMDNMPLSSQARARLGQIQRDEATNCAALLDLLRAQGMEPSRAVGAFFEKALAMEGVRARLEFLNRGQAWVARCISEALPRITDPAVKSMLLEMKDSHLANIVVCEELIGTLEPATVSPPRGPTAPRAEAG